VIEGAARPALILAEQFYAVLAPSAVNVVDCQVLCRAAAGTAPAVAVKDLRSVIRLILALLLSGWLEVGLVIPVRSRADAVLAVGSMPIGRIRPAIEVI